MYGEITGGKYSCDHVGGKTHHQPGHDEKTRALTEPSLCACCGWITLPDGAGFACTLQCVLQLLSHTRSVVQLKFHQEAQGSSTVLFFPFISSGFDFPLFFFLFREKKKIFSKGSLQFLVVICAMIKIFYFIFFYFFSFSFFFSFFGHPEAYGVPGPGIRSELQSRPRL